MLTLSFRKRKAAAAIVPKVPETPTAPAVLQSGGGPSTYTGPAAKHHDARQASAGWRARLRAIAAPAHNKPSAPSLASHVQTAAVPQRRHHARHSTTSGRQQHQAARLKLAAATNEVLDACTSADLDELRDKIRALNVAYDQAVNGLTASEPRERPQGMADVIVEALANLTPREPLSESTLGSSSPSGSPDAGRGADGASIRRETTSRQSSAGSMLQKLAAARQKQPEPRPPVPETGSFSKWTAVRRNSVLAKARGAVQPMRRGSLLSGPAEPLLATRYDPETSSVRGFLIDLDGTMYDPAGLLPGAVEFYHWLVASGTPHVFLSNTGAKNSTGVQKKFATPPYVLSRDQLVPLDNILTAAEAQVDYVSDQRQCTQPCTKAAPWR